MSPEEVLKKGKYHRFVHWIFHFDFKEHQAIFKDQTSDEKHIAVALVKIMPVFFGIDFNMLEIEMSIELCPPSLLMIQKLKKFNLSLHLLSTFIPVNPMRQLMVNHLYHSRDIFSKIVARIIFSAVCNGVSKSNKIQSNLNIIWLSLKIFKRFNELEFIMC